VSETSPIDGTVELSVPADVVFVATLRLVAASLAVRCDLTVDDIEDLRLAVDEACALLLPVAAVDAGITARFTLAPGCLEVTTSIATVGAGVGIDRSGFAWTVLTALASDVGIETEQGRCTIVVTKRREAAER
jgi:serine/threonine-protein kinase RsbW